MAAYTLIETGWARDATRLAAVRRAVFVDEQGVPEAMEWDEHDAASVHFLAVADDGAPIGCARLLPDGHIGRMAVLPAWRGRGVGRALLAAAMDAARARPCRAAPQRPDARRRVLRARRLRRRRPRIRRGRHSPRGHAESTKLNATPLRRAGFLHRYLRIY